MTEYKLKGMRIVEVVPMREMMLEYFMLYNNMEETDQSICYGIEIRKTELDEVEVETINGITDSKESAEHLIDLLLENTVTPVSLVNIVDDYITEKVCS